MTGSTVDRARRLLGHLLPAAVAGPERLADAIDRLNRPQLDACVVLAALFDQHQQSGGARFVVDAPDLDEIADAAAKSPSALLDATRNLSHDAAAQALAELLLLHVHLATVRTRARTAAAHN